MYKLSNLIQNQLMFIGQPPASNSPVTYHGTFNIPEATKKEEKSHISPPLDTLELAHQNPASH